MGPNVHLLGVPQVSLPDGTPLPMRGRKAWGLLAFLLLRRESVSRQHLAQLLFDEAEDPLAALRWNLTELRRALGQDTLRGDPLRIDRDVLGFIDLDVLLRGKASDGVQLPGLGHELLEGLSFSGSPSFEVWIEAERRRVQATSQAVLHEAALVRLAAGQPEDAADLAGRLVRLDPLDENAQVLLVRSLAAAGNGIGAARQAATCRELFSRALGVAPWAALTDALHTATSTPIARPATGRAGVVAQLEAGEAAIGAGVLDAGLQCLRRAIAEADQVGDPELRARARVALGGALVHAARGRDGEGAAALHEALAIGTEAAPGLAAGACRELGYVEFLLGRYDRALAWTDRADPLAGADVAERARIATLQGSILSDVAHYDTSLARLRHARALCDDGRDAKQQVYVDAMIGRVLVLTGQLDEARTVLDHCIGQARSLWIALLPWPQSFRAEIDLKLGQIASASERFEQAFALGCQLADPCWEGIAGRGLGLVAHARGDTDRAMSVLLDTLERCGRLPDAYVWGRAYVLDAVCGVAIERRDPRARGWAEQLMRIAARAGMRELVARAYLHGARLGDPEAASAARLLASEVGNPVLIEAVD